MKTATIIHNPRCSKSRQTLALLEEHNISVEIIEYLKHPLDKNQLSIIKEKLNIDSYLEMMRPKEAEFKEAQLTKQSSEQEFLNGMEQYPKLIERPIVITELSARIGRPPENVLELFK